MEFTVDVYFGFLAPLCFAASIKHITECLMRFQELSQAFT